MEYGGYIFWQHRDAVFPAPGLTRKVNKQDLCFVGSQDYGQPDRFARAYDRTRITSIPSRYTDHGGKKPGVIRYGCPETTGNVANRDGHRTYCRALWASARIVVAYLI